MTEQSATVNHTAACDALHLADAGEPFQLERRTCRRQPVQQRVTAVVTNLAPHSDAELRICSLLLTDLSPVGAGAMVQEPLPQGAQITVFCPPHGPESGFDLQGEIVRCQRMPNGAGYHLGIHIQARMAA